MEDVIVLFAGVVDVELCAGGYHCYCVVVGFDCAGYFFILGGDAGG